MKIFTFFLKKIACVSINNKKMRNFVLAAKQFVKRNISLTLKSNQKTNETDSMKNLPSSSVSG